MSSLSIMLRTSTNDGYRGQMMDRRLGSVNMDNAHMINYCPRHVKSSGFCPNCLYTDRGTPLAFERELEYERGLKS